MKYWLSVLTAVCLGIIGFSTAGCQRGEDAGEETMDTMEEAGEETMDTMEDAGEETMDAAEEAREETEDAAEDVTQ